MHTSSIASRIESETMSWLVSWLAALRQRCNLETQPAIHFLPAFMRRGAWRNRIVHRRYFIDQTAMHCSIGVVCPKRSHGAVVAARMKATVNQTTPLGHRVSDQKQYGVVWQRASWHCPNFRSKFAHLKSSAFALISPTNLPNSWAGPSSRP